MSSRVEFLSPHPLHSRLWELNLKDNRIHWRFKQMKPLQVNSSPMHRWVGKIYGQISDVRLQTLTSTNSGVAGWNEAEKRCTCDFNAWAHCESAPCWGHICCSSMAVGASWNHCGHREAAQTTACDIPNGNPTVERGSPHRSSNHRAINNKRIV